MPRPTADVKVGDVLTVQRSITNETIYMAVQSAGPTFITAKGPGSGGMRFRRDTQSTNDQRFRFKTDDQAAYDDRLNRARKVLVERGFLVGYQAAHDEVIAVGEFLTAWDTEHNKELPK